MNAGVAYGSSIKGSTLRATRLPARFAGRVVMTVSSQSSNGGVAMKSLSNKPQSKRRIAVKALGTAVALALAGIGPVGAQAPKSPQTINIVDVAGDLALTQEAFEL